MSLIRPEVLALLVRWREMAGALALAAVALWLFALGGWILQPLGLVLGALALGWGLMVVRRMRFHRAVTAPGVIEVDEGQVGYLGPTFGGFLSLRELVEIRLIDLHGTRNWRLKQNDGQVLLIPATAAGADALFDAFAVLPGIDMARLASALDAPASTAPLWRAEGASITKLH